ncbi:MAG: cell division ATP-binding protein FtsE [Cellvibrionales bacterium]|nr:cell division ATP-binding protein FtsE [Cellvibrionales bacterium]
MIRFDNVSKRYATGFEALQNVSFEVASEEMVFLTGHSGAGKSTLLKLITLIERQTRGQIYVNDRPLSLIANRKIPFHRRQIGVVFQNHHLLFDRSVFDNVALPLQVIGFPERDIARRVRAALDKVGLLDKEKVNPIALSGGQQQRVGIARAVVHKPSILLADEPTGNLDDDISKDILHLFRQFNHVGVTVMIATHDKHLLEVQKSRNIELDHGALVYR